MTARCDHVNAALSAFLDASLTPTEASSVAEHLAACSRCLIELDALRRTQSLLASAGKLAAPEACVREARAAAAAPAGRRRAEARRFGPPWALSSLAAAAALAVVLFSLRLFERAAPVESPASDDARAIRFQVPPSGAKEKAAEIADAKKDGREGAAGKRNETPGKPTAPDQAARAARAAPGPAAGATRPGTESRAVLKKQAEPPPSPAAEARTAEEARPDSAGSRIAALKAARAPENALPFMRVTLAQIRFTEESGRALAPALDSLRDEARTKPPSAGGVVHSLTAPNAAMDALKVVVILDASSRILSARSIEPNPTPAETALVERLRGATVDLGGAPGTLALAPGEMILEILLPDPPAPAP